jgi:spore germination protein GerM
MCVVLASCSRGAEVHLLSRDELPKALYEPSSVERADRRTVRALLYFARTTSDGRLLVPNRLGVVSRERVSDRSAIEVVVAMLLQGPTPAEQQDGYRTAIPPATELLGVSVENGLADVNLTAQFEAAGAEVLQKFRVAQVVWTLTELPEVDAVQFRIHGAPQPVIDQFGVAHDRVGRGRYSRLEPRDVGGEDIEGSVAPFGTAEP